MHSRETEGRPGAELTEKPEPTCEEPGPVILAPRNKDKTDWEKASKCRQPDPRERHPKHRVLATARTNARQIPSLTLIVQCSCR